MTSSIKVCLVGVGRAGQVHAASLVKHIPEGKLTALVDLDQVALEKTADRFGVDSWFSSLEEAIDRVPFEAVILTTPTFTHRELVTIAALRRKHVFCEKPMALTIDDCDEMIAAAERNSVLL